MARAMPFGSGVPQPAFDRLRDAVVKTITEPAYVERQAQGGSEITPTTPEEMRQIQIAEIQLYRDMMKIAGIDKEAHIGDPAFQDVPVARLLSDAYADACAARMSSLPSSPGT